MPPPRRHHGDAERDQGDAVEQRHDPVDAAHGARRGRLREGVGDGDGDELLDGEQDQRDDGGERADPSQPARAGDPGPPDREQPVREGEMVDEEEDLDGGEPGRGERVAEPARGHGRRHEREEHRRGGPGGPGEDEQPPADRPLPGRRGAHVVRPATGVASWRAVPVVSTSTATAISSQRASQPARAHSEAAAGGPPEAIRTGVMTTKT